VLHAFRGIAPEPVLAQARAIDASLAEGTVPGPLCGLPVGVKDSSMHRAG
jgi:Asp-tRNA(Asn)/Glu-tRNA(Gln) amidotransferase A subunit family amidase